MICKKFGVKLSLVATCCLAVMCGGSSLIANEQSLELESIEVIGSSGQESKRKK